MPATSTLLSHNQRLHQAFDAGVTDLHRALAGLGDSDRRRGVALATWFAGFAVELKTHQRSIAELVIPTIARRRPLVADELAEQVADHHCAVADLLEDLGDVLDRFGSRVQPWTFNHRRAVELAGRLEQATHASIETEVREVLPVMAHLHPAELHDIDLRTAALVPVRQAAFSCPWLVASLHAGERDVVLARAPRSTRLIWTLTQRRYARLAETAFGPNPRPHLQVVPNLPVAVPRPMRAEPAFRPLQLVPA